MILAVAAALLAPVGAGLQTAAPDNEVVVVGERLRHLRIVTKRDRGTGATRCLIKPSSGDAFLDAGVCGTYLACAPKVLTAPALEACMRPPLTELVASWIERRRRRMTGTAR